MQIIAFAEGPDFNTEWPGQDAAVQWLVRDGSGNNKSTISSIITTTLVVFTRKMEWLLGKKLRSKSKIILSDLKESQDS